MCTALGGVRFMPIADIKPIEVAQPRATNWSRSIAPSVVTPKCALRRPSRPQLMQGSEVCRSTSADRNQEMHVWDCPWRATTEVTRESTMPYRIRVTPKTGGDRLHVFGLRNGPTPKIGVELDVILGDRRIRARVTNVHLPVSKMDGASVDEVYANEI